jgi:hypothetical protein
MQAGLVCNEAAEQALKASDPPSQPAAQSIATNCVPFVDAPTTPAAGTPRMTASEATSVAKGFTTTVNPATHSLTITAAQWSNMCAPRGEAPTANGLVWIITVDAPFTAGSTFDNAVPISNSDPGAGYSVIIDDSSQSALVVCTVTTSGCPIYSY